MLQKDREPGARDPWEQKDNREADPWERPQGQPGAVGTEPPPETAPAGGGYSPQLELDGAGNPLLAQLRARVEQAQRSMAGAQGFSIFIAVVNAGLGAILLFLPSFLDLGLDAANGIGLVLFGVIYFGLAIGIGRYSRACALAAVILMGLDTLLSLGTGNVGGSAFRAFILLLLIGGTISAFRYHALRRQYAVDPDPQIAALFVRRKKLGGLNLFCLIAGGVSLLLLVAGAALSLVSVLAMPGDPKAEVDTWQTQTLPGTSLSLRMPQDYRLDESGQQNEPPFFLAEGGDESLACVTVVCYPGLLEGLQPEQQPALLTPIYQSFADSLLAEAPEPEAGFSSETGDYLQGIGSFEGSPGVAGALRVFAAQGDCYVLFFTALGEPDERQFINLSTEFFASVQSE